MATLLATGRHNLFVVAGLGSPHLDAVAAGDDDRNFYLWGAMGGAAMIGLGLALAQPKRRVARHHRRRRDADGPRQPRHHRRAEAAATSRSSVFDNGPMARPACRRATPASAVDLAAVARGCGISDSQIIVDEDDLQSFAGRIHRVGQSSAVGVIKINQGETARVLPSRDAAFLKDRFRIAVAAAPT